MKRILISIVIFSCSSKILGGKAGKGGNGKDGKNGENGKDGKSGIVINVKK
jgi:hypothetical protein